MRAVVEGRIHLLRYFDTEDGVGWTLANQLGDATQTQPDTVRFIRAIGGIGSALQTCIDTELWSES